MALALGRLHLRPADLWSMTPRELEAALIGLLGPMRSEAPLPRSVLDDLMAQYPDRSELRIAICK